MKTSVVRPCEQCGMPLQRKQVRFHTRACYEQWRQNHKPMTRPHSPATVAVEGQARDVTAVETAQTRVRLTAWPIED